MLDLGVYNAINLDGGGSTSMVVQGANGKPSVLENPSTGAERYADYLNSQPVSHCSESLCRCSANALDHRKSRETVSTQFGRVTFLENWSAIR
jgi:hypothetical protein